MLRQIAAPLLAVVLYSCSNSDRVPYAPSTEFSFELHCLPRYQTVQLPYERFRMVAADFDGDGAVDVLFINPDRNICVLRNTTPQKVEALGELEEKVR